MKKELADARLCDNSCSRPRLFLILSLIGVGFVAGLRADAQPDARRQSEGIGPLAGQKFVRMTGDLLGYELTPSYSGMYKAAPFRTNRWGMRDKEYTVKPPRDTYRIALVGSSYSMGGGVPVEQTFQWLLEERLNREGPGAPRRRYEILNFAVGGYGVFQNAVLADKKIPQFAPNAILLTIQSLERPRLISHIISLVKGGVPIPYPYVRQKLQEAGVRPGMEDPELNRRIGPISIDLMKWSFRQIAELSREHGTLLVGVVLPLPRSGDYDQVGRSIAMAREAGIQVVRVEGVYNGVSFDAVRLKGDIHWNALGHKLIADHLYEALRANDGGALKVGFAPPKS